MKITGIELYHVSVPLKEIFRPSWIPGYPQTHNRFTLIKLITNEGIVGYSAGAAMGRERQGLGDLLGGYLMGEDPADIDRIQSLLKQAGYLGWRNFWIEPACWDIIGKKEGKPVYEVLEGKSRPLPVYLSTGEMRDLETIEAAVRSRLEEGYPELEVVLVDDRSEDGTGAIIDRIAAEHPRVRAVHVGELPAGWLGKVHAQQVGWRAASGDYLLFTDADVHFNSGTLRAAMSKHQTPRSRTSMVWNWPSGSPGARTSPPWCTRTGQ